MTQLIFQEAGRAMAGEDPGFGRKLAEASQRFPHRPFIAAGEIAPADIAAKKRIAGKDEIFGNQQDAPCRVAGSTDDPQGKRSGRDAVSVFK